MKSDEEEKNRAMKHKWINIKAATLWSPSGDRVPLTIKDLSSAAVRQRKSSNMTGLTFLLFLCFRYARAAKMYGLMRA